MDEIQPEFSKKELRHERREERRSAEEQARKKKKIMRVVWWVVGIGAIGALIGGITWAIIANRPAPLGEDFSHAVPNEGATHITEGDKVTYQSNPPTSGNHWPDPLRDGIYDEQKPDEAIVHSMEHGRVWVAYKPSISEQTRQALRALVKSEPRVVMTPRAANETDIALVAWDRIDTFNVNPDGSFDGKRVRDFIRRYRDKGPEYVPQMSGKSY